MGSCDILLNDYFSWANQQDLRNGKALVDCSIVSNQVGNIVTFATGVLEFSPAEALVDVITQPAQFSGELVQVFSDLVGNNNLPFDPDHADRTRVTISGGGGPVVRLSPPSVSISLISQNEVSFRFEPQCLAGVIYGVGRAHGAPPSGALASEALYVISLGNQRYEANA